MGLIIKVKVSHYVVVHTDEMDVETALELAEAEARAKAEDADMGEVDIDTLEIIGCTEIPDDDIAYEERRDRKYLIA